MVYLEAIITSSGDIRCPICNKKLGEITGKEEVKNFKLFCRGKKGTGNHCCILNTGSEVKDD